MPIVIALLLCFGERLELHFQLHGPRNILSLCEPEDHVIALLDAALLLSVLLIQSGQLKCPALGILPLLIFPKDFDLLGKGRSLCPEQLVLQDIARRVVRGELFELLIIFLRFIVEAHADLNFSEPVKNSFAGRGLSVRIL